MIYITGDIHGSPERLGVHSFYEQKGMTRDDIVIICGDFGMVWEENGESASERYWLKWLEDKPFTTVFVSAEDENWRETAKEWYKAGKMYRIKGISWWEQELPTQGEMDSGIKNLERVGNKVDYIITHSPSASVIALLGHGLYEQDVLTRYLEDIRSKVEYKKHFCGHMHVDKAVNEKDIILYEQIIRLA